MTIVMFIWLAVFTVGLLGLSTYLISATNEHDDNSCAIAGGYALLGCCLGFFLLIVCFDGGCGSAKDCVPYTTIERLSIWALLVPYYILPSIGIGIYNWIQKNKEVKDRLEVARQKWEAERKKEIDALLNRYGV